MKEVPYWTVSFDLPAENAEEARKLFLITLENNSAEFVVQQTGEYTEGEDEDNG